MSVQRKMDEFCFHCGVFYNEPNDCIKDKMRMPGFWRYLQVNIYLVHLGLGYRDRNNLSFYLNNSDHCSDCNLKFNIVFNKQTEINKYGLMFQITHTNFLTIFFL